MFPGTEHYRSKIKKYAGVLRFKVFQSKPNLSTCEQLLWNLPKGCIFVSRSHSVSSLFFHSYNTDSPIQPTGMWQASEKSQGLKHPHTGPRGPLRHTVCNCIICNMTHVTPQIRQQRFLTQSLTVHFWWGTVKNSVSSPILPEAPAILWDQDLLRVAHEKFVSRVWASSLRPTSTLKRLATKVVYKQISDTETALLKVLVTLANTISISYSANNTQASHFLTNNKLVGEIIFVSA